jgi:hypothetical protein
MAESGESRLSATAAARDVIAALRAAEGPVSLRVLHKSMGKLPLNSSFSVLFAAWRL